MNFKRLVMISLTLIFIIGAGITLNLQGLGKNGGIALAKSKDQNQNQNQNNNQKQSKNLIVLIGDGMGPAQITLSRIYGQKYEGIEKLVLDNYLVGMNSTFAGDSSDVNESGLVTDSAASGTAFATGNKTYNGAIAVTNADVAKPVASILEAAQSSGKATGLISTARITHATPAVYASHVRSRDNENAIASQYAVSGVDVFLGGGERHFTANKQAAKYGDSKRSDGIDVIQTFKSNGYDVVYDKEGLENVKAKKLVGLFDNTHMPYNIDRGEKTPSLKEQLEKAISILEKNDQGFVIMLEGGRIDHAGHANDLHGIAMETLEFDEAFKAAIDYAKSKGNTSVIATADHETGGLSIGSRNTYDAYFDVIKKVNASTEIIGKELEKATSPEMTRSIVQKYTEINDLTDAEVALIMSGNLADGSPSSYKREGSLNAVLSQRSLFGWTGHGHSGVDVGVYGYGPAAELLRGFTDNTDFAKAGAEVLNLDLEKATAELQNKYLYPKFLLTRDKQIVLPAESLADLLGFKISKQGNNYVINGENKTLEIKQGVNQVEIDQKMYPVQIDEGKLYVSIEVIDYVTKRQLSWDKLSERIVLN